MPPLNKWKITIRVCCLVRICYVYIASVRSRRPVKLAHLGPSPHNEFRTKLFSPKSNPIGIDLISFCFFAHENPPIYNPSASPVIPTKSSARTHRILLATEAGNRAFLHQWKFGSTNHPPKFPQCINSSPQCINSSTDDRESCRLTGLAAALTSHHLSAAPGSHAWTPRLWLCLAQFADRNSRCRSWKPSRSSRWSFVLVHV
jgi:hypothetical protein